MESHNPESFPNESGIEMKAPELFSEQRNNSTPNEAATIDVEKELLEQVEALKLKFKFVKASPGWVYFLNAEDNESFHTIINAKKKKKYVIGDFIEVGIKRKKGFVVRIGYRLESNRKFMSIWFVELVDEVLLDSCSISRLSDVDICLDTPVLNISVEKLEKLQKNITKSIQIDFGFC